MGLCTSKSSVTLDPGAHLPDAHRPTGGGSEWDTPSRTPILDEGVLMVQPAKSKNDTGGAKTQTKSKGYLELGGKGGTEGEAHMSRDNEEDEEDRDGVEEMVNFSHSEGSLQSEFLELS